METKALFSGNVKSIAPASKQGAFQDGPVPIPFRIPYTGIQHITASRVPNAPVYGKLDERNIDYLSVPVLGGTGTEKVEARYFPPADSLGGWRQPANAKAARSIAGMDTKKLEEAFAFIQGETKNGGIVVLRKGWLVYENYFGLGHREALANLASCGKSLTSIATGILMAEKAALFPDGLQQKVFTPTYFPAEAFPLTDPAKAEISLGQLLTFTAGIRGNNPSYVSGQPKIISPAGPDGIQACFDEIAFGKKDMSERGETFSARDLWCAPGGGYSYATSSIHLVSIILRHVSGMELEAFLQTRLAGPLGWGRWGYGYKNTLGSDRHTPGGGGIVLRPTDMLRFGYLLLNEGRWKGQQVVPAEYVRHCARKSPFNPHFPYSLQFDVNTDGHFPELPRDAFWKTGSGGHVLYVVPSLDLVVWKLGGRDSQYDSLNTGLKVHPDAAAITNIRTGWNQTVESKIAVRKTLAMVLESIVQK